MDSDLMTNAVRHFLLTDDFSQWTSGCSLVDGLILSPGWLFTVDTFMLLVPLAIGVTESNEGKGNCWFTQDSLPTNSNFLNIILYINCTFCVPNARAAI